MTQDEIITVDGLPRALYDKVITEALDYALLSIAFTYDRMRKKDVKTRIHNIVKGKVAEGLFYEFCKANNIQIKTDECSTPFYLPDYRDFLYMRGEWDLKNNFYYPKENKTNYSPEIHLPCLIPDNYVGDQWTKRNKHYFTETTFVGFLFSFMPLKSHEGFFQLHLSQAQLKFIEDVSDHFRYAMSAAMPVNERWFKEKIKAISESDVITSDYYPPLVLTACANLKYWNLYSTVGTEVDDQKYLNHLHPVYYQLTGNVVKYMGGCIVTTIQNKICPVEVLPSFYSINPQLKSGMKYASLGPPRLSKW
ncbi:MAG: hypothetical protein R2774_05615 [Saprospiraceae bacterium]